MHTPLLTRGKMGPTLLRFALPFLLSSVLQALYGAADLFVVGQFTGSAAVSAVSIGSQVMQTLTGIILGFSMGGTVLIGQCVGAQDGERTAVAVGNMAVAFALLAALLTPAMLLLTRPAAHLMQTPAEALSDTERYLWVCACGLPFIIGYNAVSGIFRGLGDSKTPVVFVAIACVLNIVLDFGLVGGLHLGALGAALATVLSQAASFSLALLYMLRRGFSFAISRRHFRLERTACRRIFKVGAPLALQDGLVNLSFLLITAIINTMGLIASASVGVVEKLMAFAFLPPGAFSSAVATVTAQNIGANQPQRAYQGLWYGVGFSLLSGVAICLYAQFFPQTLTRIFSNDPAVVAQASQYMRSYAIDCILVSLVFCMNAYFSGCGRSMVSLLHSLAATFLVRVPLSYGLSRLPGISLYAIGFAAPAATLLSVFICLWYLGHLRRQAARGLPTGFP